MKSREVAQCTALGAGGGLIALTLGPHWAVSLMSSPAVAIAVAAGIAALLAQQPRWLEASGVAGLVLLAISPFVGTGVSLDIIGVALLLGCLAGLAKTALLQASLAGGVLLGLALDDTISALGESQRYAAYSSTSLNVPELALIIITAGALLLANWSAAQQADAQVLAVSVGLPLVVLLEARLSDPMVFAVVQAVTVIGAAFLVPGRAGLVLLAGGAAALAPLSTAYPSLLGALIVAGMVVTGLVLGQRWPLVAAGIAAVALAAFPFAYRIEFFAAIALFIVVLGTAHAFASALAVPGAVLATAVAMPFFPFVQQRVNFGSGAYTPLTSNGILPPNVLAGWLPFLVLAAFAIAAYFLARRTARR